MRPRSGYTWRWAIVAAMAMAVVLTAAARPMTPAVGSVLADDRRDQVIYQDALGHPSLTHPQVSAAETPLRFEHGMMRARETIAGDATYLATKDLPGTTTQLANVAVEAFVRNNSGTTAAGVYCRGTVTGTYVFVIGATRFGIFKGTAAGATAGNPYAYQPLLAQRSPKFIHPGTTPNRIRGECTAVPGGGVQLRMIVNAKIVATRLDTTAPNPVGGVGLYIEADPGAKGDASFSKLAVTQLRR